MNRIAKYELRELIGRGGMGLVYRAHDTVMDREVAVKLIQERSLQVPELKARFIQEARMAGKLSHPNITTIHDLGEIDGTLFIVMELLFGTDVRTIIDRRDPLSLEQRLDIAGQLLRGLDYAHVHGIVHRDVKPENLKLLGDGRVKIMDFGIAKPLIAAAAADGEEIALTTAGTQIGTPWYMSPEQVSGDPVDRRSDIFSAGVVIYELLTYSRPFEGDKTTVLYRIVHADPEPMVLEDPALGAHLNRVIRKCLAKAPDERYNDCQEVLRDLAEAPALRGALEGPRGLVEEGKGLAQEHRFTEAKEKIGKALQINPGSREAQESMRQVKEEQVGFSIDAAHAGDIIGKTVSHFRILEKIGDGGMGVVYKAEDLALGRTVALKFLVSGASLDPEARKRLLKEAQAASMLDHPNICTIHEIGETPGGLPFICMAYYQGKNLGKLLETRVPEAAEGLAIGIGIARGLARAHESGIVHRDIKPANIIITTGGEVKIVDFGLAKLTSGAAETRAGTTLGTVQYMSPEQVRGEAVDHRTDIWALGALLYQVLTGKVLFEAAYEAAIYYAILNEDTPSPSSIRPDLPDSIDRILARALRKSPEERYPAMQDLLVDLEEAAREAGWRETRPRLRYSEEGQNRMQPTGEGEAESALSTKSPSRIRPTEVGQLLENGKAYLERGEYGEALSRFEAVLSLSPGDQEAARLRDECLQKQADVEQSRSLTERARPLLERGKLDEAHELLLGARTLHPANDEAAELLRSLEETITRKEQIERHLMEGELALRYRRFPEAREAYNRVLVLDPGRKEALQGLQRVEKEQSRRTKATVGRTPPPVPARVSRQSGARTPVPGGKSRFTISLAVVLGALTLLGVTLWFMFRPEQAGRPGPTFAADSTQPGITVQHPPVATNPIPGGKQGEAAGSIASPSAPAPAETVRDLRAVVAGARKAMLSERSLAERTGARSDARGRYDEAARRQAEGERLMKSTKEADLAAAQRAFTDARDLYRTSAVEAAAVAGPRSEADLARLAMRLAKQKMPGAEKDRQASGNYRQGLAAEQGAESAYKSSQFDRARQGFSRAEQLYHDAEGEVQGLLARAETPVEKKPPETPPLVDKRAQGGAGGPEGGTGTERDASRTADTRSAEPKEGSSPAGESGAGGSPAGEPVRNATSPEVRTAIEGLVNRFKESIEQGDSKDLSALLGISEESAQGWNDFFSSTENRSVTILGPVNMDIKGDSARVSFRMRISFLNTTTNAPDTDERSRTWTVAGDNGAWRIVAQRVSGQK